MCVRVCEREHLSNYLLETFCPQSNHDAGYSAYSWGLLQKWKILNQVFALWKKKKIESLLSKSRHYKKCSAAERSTFRHDK